MAARKTHIRPAPAARPTINNISMAAKLGVSTRTLKRLRNAGKIPYIRVGRQVRYFEDEVDRALREDGGTAA